MARFEAVMALPVLSLTYVKEDDVPALMLNRPWNGRLLILMASLGKGRMTHENQANTTA
jgi:hypothetical protein